MAQAKRRSNTKPSPDNLVLASALAPDKLPERYQCQCFGDCLHPKVKDGSRLEFSTKEVYQSGDFVAIWLHPQFVAEGAHQLVVKRYLMRIGGGGNLKSVTGEYGVYVQTLNPPVTFFIPERAIEAIHKMVRVVKANEPRAFLTPQQIAAMSRDDATPRKVAAGRGGRHV